MSYLISVKIDINYPIYMRGLSNPFFSPYRKKLGKKTCQNFSVTLPTQKAKTQTTYELMNMTVVETEISFA